MYKKILFVTGVSMLAMNFATNVVEASQARVAKEKLEREAVAKRAEAATLAAAGDVAGAEAARDHVVGLQRHGAAISIAPHVAVAQGSAAAAPERREAMDIMAEAKTEIQNSMRNYEAIQRLSDAHVGDPGIAGATVAAGLHLRQVTAAAAAVAVAADGLQNAIREGRDTAGFLGAAQAAKADLQRLAAAPVAIPAHVGGAVAGDAANLAVHAAAIVAADLGVLTMEHFDEFLLDARAASAAHAGGTRQHEQFATIAAGAEGARRAAQDSVAIKNLAGDSVGAFITVPKRIIDAAIATVLDHNRNTALAVADATTKAAVVNPAHVAGPDISAAVTQAKVHLAAIETSIGTTIPEMRRAMPNLTQARAYFVAQGRLRGELLNIEQEQFLFSQQLVKILAACAKVTP